MFHFLQNPNKGHPNCNYICTKTSINPLTGCTFFINYKCLGSLEWNTICIVAADRIVISYKYFFTFFFKKNRRCEYITFHTMVRFKLKRLESRPDFLALHRDRTWTLAGEWWMGSSREWLSVRKRDKLQCDSCQQTRHEWVRLIRMWSWWSVGEALVKIEFKTFFFSLYSAEQKLIVDAELQKTVSHFKIKYKVSTKTRHNSTVHHTFYNVHK